MSVISNTTVISNFASINQHDLLRRLFGYISIPTQVYDEIRAGFDEGYQFYEGINKLVYPIENDGWLHLASISGEAELRDFGCLPDTLHPGEAACLAIAKHRNWLLLTDDRAARRAGFEWDVRISGTLGCLMLTVERGYCTLELANRYLSEMIQQGYYAPVTDLTVLGP